MKFIDVISIEAKIWGTADDIAHAYEAIAYKRFSTHVWYAYEVPNEGVAVSQEVDSVLRENGVGIIRIWRAGGEDKIRIDSRPERVDPPPDRVEAWLDLLSQADESGEVKKLLHSMFR